MPAVGAELDVRVGVGMHARADRDVLPGLRGVVGQGDREDRLAVGAHEFAEPVAETRQRTVQFALGQQAVGAERAGGNDHTARAEGARFLREPGPRSLRGDLVAIAAIARTHGADVGDLAVADDGRALLLGEPEIVLEQRVLGAHPAADHALAAARATGACRSFAAEVRIGHFAPGFTEEDTDRSARERVADAEVLTHSAQQVLGAARVRHGRDAEHALCGLVVRTQDRAPVFETDPLWIGEEGGLGAVERVGVDRAPAADCGTRRDEDVLERRKLEDPAQAYRGRPEEALEIPGGRRVLVVCVAVARLDDQDLVALLAESQRRYAAAETGTDDDPVVFLERSGHRSIWRGRAWRRTEVVPAGRASQRQVLSKTARGPGPVKCVRSFLQPRV